MITNAEMKERIEKAYKVLGTRNPTMKEYAKHLFQHKKDSVK